MKRRLSAVEARKRLGEILEGVYYRGDEVVIERAGKPMAVVIPAERYRSMEASREKLFDLIEEAQQRNEDVPFEVVEAEVAEAVAEARQARRTTART